MSAEYKSQSAKLVCFLFFVFCFASCGSIPNLETPECNDARNAVREFYSFHFGGDMKSSKENLQLGGKFLSGELKRKLSAQPDGATDYFTQTDDYPKAFRIGNCTVAGENKTVLQVVFFWKDEKRSEQREVKVEAVKENDKWLIDTVGN